VSRDVSILCVIQILTHLQTHSEFTVILLSRCRVPSQMISWVLSALSFSLLRVIHRSSMH